MNETIGGFWIIWGRVGVNIFGLITGYFLCEKTRSTKSILKLWIQAFFYSITLYFVSLLAFGDGFSVMDMASYFLPVSFKKWWYVSGVIGLYMISAILNILVNSLGERKHRYLLVVMTFMQVVIPLFTNQKPYYSDMSWLIYLYLIAAYIKLHCSIDGRTGE